MPTTPADNSALSKEHWSLLASYSDGPLIWDATSVFERVCDLSSLGLVRQSPGASNSYCYELTDAGRSALEGRA